MENLELRRLYADPGQATDAVDRDDVANLAVSIWTSEHVGQIEAVEDITRLRELIQTSTRQLDEAFGCARCRHALAGHRAGSQHEPPFGARPLGL